MFRIDEETRTINHERIQKSKVVFKWRNEREIMLTQWSEKRSIIVHRKLDSNFKNSIYMNRKELILSIERDFYQRFIWWCTSGIIIHQQNQKAIVVKHEPRIVFWKELREFRKYSFIYIYLIIRHLIQIWIFKTQLTL